MSQSRTSAVATVAKAGRNADKPSKVYPSAVTMVEGLPPQTEAVKARSKRETHRNKTKNKLPISVRCDLENALVDLCDSWFEEIKPHLVRNNIKLHVHPDVTASCSSQNTQKPICCHLDPGAFLDVRVSRQLRYFNYFQATASTEKCMLCQLLCDAANSIGSALCQAASVQSMPESTAHSSGGAARLSAGTYDVLVSYSSKPHEGWIVARLEFTMPRRSNDKTKMLLSKDGAQQTKKRSREQAHKYSTSSVISNQKAFAESIQCYAFNEGYLTKDTAIKSSQTDHPDIWTLASLLADPPPHSRHTDSQYKPWRDLLNTKQFSLFQNDFIEMLGRRNDEILSNKVGYPSRINLVSSPKECKKADVFIKPPWK